MAYWYIQRTPIRLAVDFLQQPTEVTVSAMTYLKCKKKKHHCITGILHLASLSFKKWRWNKDILWLVKLGLVFTEYYYPHILNFLFFCTSVSIHIISVSVSSFQSLSPVWLFAAPFTAAWQAYLSIINSQSLLKTHVHRVSDAIQPSHPLLSPSHPSFNLS